jgi:replication factor C subunit 3/5
MFLVDKYYNEYNNILYESNYIINSFNENKINNNNNNKYNNFQHLIVYGPPGSNKDFFVNKLLEDIFGKDGIELRDIEYTITGYSNTNVKILIKQSRNHLIIEPNSNGFDKYLIQEIIQNYAKSEVLNIIKQTNVFKVIVINKIYNLSYYAQAALRRTMEKYSNICKFILISDQLSKVIEPLRSRCLLVRISLPSNINILNTILYISYKENINISLQYINKILSESDNKITHAIWLLEMYKYNINYDKNWENIIDKIILLIINIKNKKILTVINKIRKYFYILFITNISTQLIIKKIMIKILNYVSDLKKKYDIINITSIYEERLILGTRHIIHMEAYIIKLFELFYN